MNCSMPETKFSYMKGFDIMYYLRVLRKIVRYLYFTFMYISLKKCLILRMFYIVKHALPLFVVMYFDSKSRYNIHEFNCTFFLWKNKYLMKINNYIIIIIIIHGWNTFWNFHIILSFNSENVNLEKKHPILLKYKTETTEKVFVKTCRVIVRSSVKTEDLINYAFNMAI